MPNPILSIVTITKHDPEGLLRTLHSIPKNCKDMEHLVIDGDPNNQAFYTPALQSQIQTLLLESDGGISEAFNKGIARAHGDYLLMLNSGDILLPQTNLPNILQILKSHDKHSGDLVAFGVFHEASQARILPTSNTHPSQIPHQGLCVKKGVYETLGGYLPSFHLRMDYEFLLRCQGQNRSPLHWEFPQIALSSYAPAGRSSQKENRKRFYQEGLAAELLHLNNPRLPTLARYLYWSLRPINRSITPQPPNP